MECDVADVGRVAALNMLNKETEINSVPFFWTVLLGKTIRYTGIVQHSHTQIHTHTQPYLSGQLCSLLWHYFKMGCTVYLI